MFIYSIDKMKNKYKTAIEDKEENHNLFHILPFTTIIIRPHEEQSANILNFKDRIYGADILQIVYSDTPSNPAQCVTKGFLTRDENERKKKNKGNFRDIMHVEGFRFPTKHFFTSTIPRKMKIPYRTPLFFSTKSLPKRKTSFPKSTE